MNERMDTLTAILGEVSCPIDMSNQSYLWMDLHRGVLQRVYGKMELKGKHFDAKNFEIHV